MTSKKGKRGERDGGESDKAEQKRLRSKGYIECPSCGKLVKPTLSRCSKCGKRMPQARKRLMIVAAAVAAVVLVIALLALLPGGQEPAPSPYVLDFSPSSTSASTSSPIMVTFSRYMDAQSVQSAFSITPYVSGQFSWNGMSLVYTPTSPLPQGTTYEVRIGTGAKDLNNRGLDSGTFGWFFRTEGSSVVLRGLGTGADQFWTSYPSGHAQSGSPVSHPQWALDALQSGPVLILDHSTNCQPCIVQTGICERVAPDYAGEMTYLDLVSGQDEPRASEAFAAYDPTGGAHYIPLTILVTKAYDSYGNTVVAWHSWEGVVYEEMLRSWIADALTHYDSVG